MGLDLILYKHTKDDMTWEEEQAAELAYGRKTWTIANFFQERCEPIEDDFYYKVKEADWEEFITSLDKLNDSSFREKVENLIDCIEESEEKQINEIEEWYDGALNNNLGYTLGFDWELSAALKWFDADEKVREAFKDGEDIRLIVSY